MKHQHEARQKQGKRKTQMKECLTLSDVQTTVRQYTNKKSPGPDGVQQFSNINTTDSI